MNDIVKVNNIESLGIMIKLSTVILPSNTILGN